MNNTHKAKAAKNKQFVENSPDGDGDECKTIVVSKRQTELKINTKHFPEKKIIEKKEVSDKWVEATLEQQKAKIKIQLGECCANKNEVITVALAIEREMSSASFCTSLHQEFVERFRIPCDSIITSSRSASFAN